MRKKFAKNRKNFNPRSPHGERRCAFFVAQKVCKFQSTLPARGATCRPRPAEIMDGISIHAPRTGSDWRLFFRIQESGNFNPRSPHGERRYHSSFDYPVWIISIHAPRTGSDLFPFFDECSNVSISIHAPRTGSDRRAADDDFRASRISIHAPRTGSDTIYAAYNHLYGISIHAPRTGSDVISPVTRLSLNRISIHAPRTGSDLMLSGYFYSHYNFNPRSPHGERQQTPCGILLSDAISIHAPRTGSDLTHFPQVSPMGYFNPRSPHGERQRKVTILSIRIIGFAQKVYHKTVLLRISLAENAVILPEKPRNPVRTSLQKAGGLRFARAIRAAHPYSISSPSGA